MYGDALVSTSRWSFSNWILLDVTYNINTAELGVR